MCRKYFLETRCLKYTYTQKPTGSLSLMYFRGCTVLVLFIVLYPATVPCGDFKPSLRHPFDENTYGDRSIDNHQTMLGKPASFIRLIFA